MAAWRAIAACAAACATLGAAGPGARGAEAGPTAGTGPDRFDTVVLDPGHGGEDDGARSASGLVEKDVVLDVTGRLARRLERSGYRVVQTRTDDRFVPLSERVSMANEAGGDLFVSIHANAAPQRWVRGVETFFLSLEASDAAARELARSENEAFRDAGFVPDGVDPGDPVLGILGDLVMSEHMTESNEFARMAQEALAERVAVRSRGVKQAPFAVLMGVQMPATLVEIGFLSNAQDEQALSKEGRRERIAAALAASVRRFAERYDARRGVAPERSVSGAGPAPDSAAGPVAGPISRPVPGTVSAGGD